MSSVIPVFYAQVYRDPNRLRWCLGHLRQCYPKARVYIVSDGDNESDWQKICKQYGVEYFKGRRLKTLDKGGQSLHRNLSYFGDTNGVPGTHLVKFDTDTLFHRKLNHWPKEMGLHGTLQTSGDQMKSVQGGCWIFTKTAVDKLVDTKIFLDPKWLNQSTWDGESDVIRNETIETGCISEDWVMGAACIDLKIPMRTCKEVNSQWRETVENPVLEWAITHPHKQIETNEKEQEMKGSPTQ